MSTIQSVSFWQQDQDYWSQARAEDQASSASNALINVMASAVVNESKGLSSIANSTALKRVNSQISALVQQVLQSSGDSTSSSGTSSGSSSSAGSGTSSTTASSKNPIPATAVGTVPVTTTTSLSTLGILPGGTITVGTGKNTTTYTSTGTDTVGDLINAINIDLPTNANVTASLNSKGQLVITSRNSTDAIFIGGSGNDAAAIGFTVGHDTFLPAKPKADAASTPSSSGASKSSPTTGLSASNSNPKSVAFSTPASQTLSTAASLLTASGVSGTLVNLLT